MDDGDWINRSFRYHSRLYKIYGDANNFSRSEVQNYPEFHVDGDGWFAYGMLWSTVYCIHWFQKHSTVAGQRDRSAA